HPLLHVAYGIVNRRLSQRKLEKIQEENDLRALKIELERLSDEKLSAWLESAKKQGNIHAGLAYGILEQRKLKHHYDQIAGRDLTGLESRATSHPVPKLKEETIALSEMWPEEIDILRHLEAEGASALKLSEARKRLINRGYVTPYGYRDFAITNTGKVALKAYDMQSAETNTAEAQDAILARAELEGRVSGILTALNESKEAYQKLWAALKQYQQIKSITR